jgi:anti-sigma regulatory factor (Ser/Thr protein kinase)
METADGGTTTRTRTRPGDRSAAETFHPTVGAPRDVRRFVAATLRRWGHGNLCDTAELLVSEVVTNVVVHAGTPGEAVLVELPDGVRIAVTDTGRQLPDPRDPSPAEPDGRGLGIVAMLSRRWGVEVEDATKTVWFELEGIRDASTSEG